MPEAIEQTYAGISESLLFTLYFRAIESQRPDALIKDEKAVALVKRMSDEKLYDFSRINLLHLSETDRLVYILRSREFDRYALDFLARNPEAVVVHIGCGLDSRFERVDNGRVEWYDLDLPNVIELRRKYLGNGGERDHLLSCSVLEEAWLQLVSTHLQRPTLFLAEGVFMYLRGEQVRSLVLRLRDHFPGAELVFDIFSPIHILRHNLQTSNPKFDIRAHWGIWHGRELEGWGNGIRLLDEWGFFDCPDARLDPIRWMRLLDKLFRTVRIYHLQLGKTAG